MLLSKSGGGGGRNRRRSRYAKFVTESQDKPTADWFAGFAALVAGDRHTADARKIEADNAYSDAIERLARSARQSGLPLTAA